jgi:hypothetical protein
MACATASGNSSCSASLPCGRRTLRMPGTVASASISARDRGGGLRPIDREHRAVRPSRQFEKLVAARNRIERAGHEADRSETSTARANNRELFPHVIAPEPRRIGVDMPGTKPAKHKSGCRNTDLGPHARRLVQAAAIPPITIPAPTLFQNGAANLTRSLRCSVEPLPKWSYCSRRR